MPDLVIDEIREIRHRISAEFDHDPAKLVVHLMRYQEQFRDRLLYVPSEAFTLEPVVQPDADKAADSRPITPVAKS